MLYYFDIIAWRANEAPGDKNNELVYEQTRIRQDVGQECPIYSRIGSSVFGRKTSMKILRAIGCAIVAASFIITCPPARANSVKNKTYTVWVSASFDQSPFLPFQDCFRFTKDQLCIAGCSGECGPLAEIPSLGLWEARVACGGVDLRFKGTSFTEPATSVIGASGIGLAEGTNFSVGGVKDSCSLPASARSAASRYKR